MFPIVLQNSKVSCTEMVGEATSIAKVPYKAYEEQKAFGRGSPGIFMEVDVN